MNSYFSRMALRSLLREQIKAREAVCPVLLLPHGFAYLRGLCARYSQGSRKLRQEARADRNAESMTEATELRQESLRLDH